VSRRSWPALALGLALALAQLALVLHQIGHELGSADEACELCLAAAHAGDAPQVARPLPAAPAPHIIVASAPPGSAPLTRTRLPCARSPPAPSPVLC
jgi:hypothetical protein